LIYLQTAGDAV